MKLLETNIRHFGKFHQVSYTFGDHINVLYGKNGAGKSTLHTFLRSMLFGMERKKGRAAHSDPYSRYMPWVSSGDYGGSLRLEHGGQICQFTRNFLTDPKNLEIFDETRNKPVPANEDFVSRMRNGLTEVTYDNTVSIGQLRGETSPAMADALKNYISNLHSTGSGNVDVAAAVAALTMQRKQLSSRLVPVDPKEYDALAAEIESLNRRLKEHAADGESARLHERRQQLQNDLDGQKETYRVLSERTGEWKQRLSAGGVESAEQLRQVETAADRAYAAYFRYRGAYRFTRHPLARGALLCLSVGMFAASFFMIFLTNASFSNDSFLPVPFLVLLCVLFFAAGRLLLSLRRHGWLWNQAKEQLRNLFFNYLGTRDILPENYDRLKKRLHSCAAMIERLKDCQLQCEALADSIRSMQEEENQILRTLEGLSRADWDNEQNQEQLKKALGRQEALRAQQRKNNEISLEIEAVKTAVSTIQSIAEDYHVSFVPQLNKACSAILSSLTRGAYTCMAVDDNLNLYIQSQKRSLPLSALSRGTAEQVYLALRLALVDCFWPDQSVPLFLDDSFALYDDERLEQALLWLEQNYKGQIFLFTCHEREEKLLNMHNIDHTFIKIY